jgi:CheY-like chemotaxis protein
MKLQHFNVLLVDDDIDDCLFFKEALEELPLFLHLTTLHDGQQLMHYLSEYSKNLPDVLFLDLNMPRKNGFECFTEIKENEKLKDIPVIMFSTAYPIDLKYEKDILNALFKIGPHYFIRKSENLEQLKQTIHHAITMVLEKEPFDGREKNL